ncbi:MAG: trypsin-like serine protease [bacterium]|nr:trypsin-like serine protease [bacterium]
MLVWFVGALTALAVPALTSTPTPTPAPRSASSTAGRWTTPTPEPSAVVGGQPVTFEESAEYAAVVALVVNSTICTGTLVDDDLILTAAHCLRGVASPDQIRVFNGLSLNTPGVEATAFGMHPDFDVEAKRDAFDFGYVSIDAGSLDATPIPVITDQIEWDAIAPTLSTDGSVVLVGYGLDPDAAMNSNLGVKKQVSTRVRDFTDSGFEFVAGGDGRDSCEGDSGGPALARAADGGFRLIGITARGSDPCGKGGFYGVPYHALAWVSGEVERPLCGEGCGECDCLDTAPERDEGCGCTTDGNGNGPWWLWVFAVGLRARRRSTS